MKERKKASLRLSMSWIEKVLGIPEGVVRSASYNNDIECLYIVLESDSDVIQTKYGVIRLNRWVPGSAIRENSLDYRETEVKITHHDSGDITINIPKYHVNEYFSEVLD